MMGEGDIAKKGPPHPFGSVCQTIVPSPARGEGKGGDITPRGARSRLELAPWLRVVVSLFALFACVFAAPARTQPAVEDFYKGKQINLIVGYGPAGRRLRRRRAPAGAPSRPLRCGQSQHRDIRVNYLTSSQNRLIM